MNKTRGLSIRLALIAALALVAVGCSKGEKDEKSPAAKTPAPATETPTPTNTAETAEAMPVKPAATTAVATSKLLALKFHHDN